MEIRELILSVFSQDDYEFTEHGNIKRYTPLANWFDVIPHNGEVQLRPVGLTPVMVNFELVQEVMGFKRNVPRETVSFPAFDLKNQMRNDYIKEHPEALNALVSTNSTLAIEDIQVTDMAMRKESYGPLKSLPVGKKLKTIKKLKKVIGNVKKYGSVKSCYEEIKELYLSGVNNSEIARKLKLKRPSVINIVNKIKKEAK